MTVATNRKLTVQEYLTYADGSDTRYELVDGDLVPMSLGTGKHGKITKFLEKALDAEILRSGYTWTAERFSIGVQSPRGTRWDTCRIPDVVVVTLEQWQELQSREAVIALNQPPPILVIEVVSASTINDDYRAKRAEYSVLDIPEYWIVDPLQNKVTVCTLHEGLYDLEEFQGSALLVSLIFPNLQLTADQVLNTGQSGEE
ncbi:MAG: Uma2 family endonuclease [Leptolyngbyaceae cyanobacterium]